jgi:hypothetical protein
MREEKPIRLIRACTEDTGILTSLIGWFDAERDKTLHRLADADDKDIYRLQGEANCLRRLRSAIAQMTKEKGQVDEQPAIRRVR